MPTHGDKYLADARTRTLRLLKEEDYENLPRLLSSQRAIVRASSNEFWRLIKQGWKVQNPYMGFKKLTQELEREGVDDPRALAAWIGRRKYGAKRFQQMAAEGRRRKW
jgi:hypothetical protein